MLARFLSGFLNAPQNRWIGTPLALLPKTPESVPAIEVVFRTIAKPKC
jgi:hypothetical protein